MPTGQDILNQLNQSPYKEAPPTTQPLQPQNMNALLAALGQGLMKPVDAAQNIMQQGDRSPSNMTIDPGQEAFNAGPMALSRIFGMAPANSASITASKLMQRSDVMKLVKEGRAQGLNEQQIAKSINDRFAPILDYGQSVRRGQVSNIAEKLRNQEATTEALNKGTYLPVNSPGVGARAVATNQNIKDLQIWQDALPHATGGRKALVEAKIKELQDKINGR